MFVDYTKVELTAGNGGPGCVSFRREKFIPKGGPNGGDGGRGGNIVLVADINLHTLQDIRYASIYKAKNGQPGSSNRKSGKDGEDIVIRVPFGTVIKEEASGMIVADMVQDNQKKILCSGGIGGKGNVHFKTSTRQTPRYAQSGKIGESGVFSFELKVLADVGLVGLPNAGKSTLLSVVSSARPKIADYPFTTLEPHLGIVKYGEYQSFVMADIPGLIKGAGEGRGLGHQFLRHIERNRILVFLIDGNDENPYDVYQTLLEELNSFNPDLMRKSRLVVKTKLDTIGKEKTHSDLWEKIPDYHQDISSVTGKGIPELIKQITELLDEA